MLSCREGRATGALSFQWRETLHPNRIGGFPQRVLRSTPRRFFAQNEIIVINNKSMYLDMLIRGIDARGNPILVVNKRYK